MSDLSDFDEACDWTALSLKEALVQHLMQLEKSIRDEWDLADPDYLTDEVTSPQAMQVFLPVEWDGIRGVLVELAFKPNTPDSLRGSVVDYRLLAAKHEFRRLLSHFYRLGVSENVSPLVVAPKTRLDSPPSSAPRVTQVRMLGEGLECTTSEEVLVLPPF